jgi:ribosome-binding protein aMBF1 (putative translation factor)
MMAQQRKAALIPAGAVFAEGRKDPEYLREYDALEREFSLANAVIGARTRAGLTQAGLAGQMGTIQSAVARLESGRARPSVATLEKLRLATGSRLRIALEAG